MITVTIGEKPKTEKPFPKLLFYPLCNAIVEVYENPENKGKYIGIHRSGDFAGTISLDFSPEFLEDYNEPITIQNA